MPQSISLLLSRMGEPPFQGSVGFVNNAIPPLLQRHGWDVRPFPPPAPAAMEETMLPFGLAGLFARQCEHGLADVALHDSIGAALRFPSRQWARRNVVLHHGLAYGAGAWLANPEIDLHCANSPYLARVLRALLAFPDWRHRRCLDPRAFDVVTDVRLPVPCVVDPDGSPLLGHGMDISPALQRLLDGPLVLGHALQPGKQDWIATLSVLYCLNQLARGHGTPPVKLLVADASLDAEQRRQLDAMLAPTGTCCADYLIPLPHLNQRALFRLMRTCRFGLAYNRFPEPFGFYVLESVHNGCPVYTNGVGNNRFLLPAEHGLVVHETPAMAAPSTGPALYGAVAETIHADLARPEAMRAACRRGGALIAQTWSPAAFEQDLRAALERVERPLPEPPAFDALEVALSPLVRSLDFVSGHLLSDYASGVLDPASRTLAQRLLGQRCGDLDGGEMSRIEAAHGFFRRGILTLAPVA
jgi:hypothetical protein